jgi:hypothetical protein
MTHFHHPYEACYPECPLPHYTAAEARLNDIKREVKEYEDDGYIVDWSSKGIKGIYEAQVL